MAKEKDGTAFYPNDMQVLDFPTVLSIIQNQTYNPDIVE